MRHSTVLLAVALAALLAPGAGAPFLRQGSRNKLLLVSFDGFRWNYDQDVDTPNLDAMARDGVKARYMTPAFVTMTSPCHFTLVTGKYIENHGVVHNMYYNTTSKVKLPYHATLGIQRWWDNGSVPIWITAQRQGLKTGSFFYPGGNVTYQGMAVTLSRKEGILHNYKNETEWRANINTVMQWFTKEDLDLVTLYFGEPDSTGHKYGPESQERKEMVRQVDRTVGYLRDTIEIHGLTDRLNLIITSDHGMTTIDKEASDLVEFHKFPNFTFRDIEFELLDYGPNGMLLPKEGMLEKVYAVLKDAHPRLHVYKKEWFPESFHYANHPRVTPLVMYSDPGYVIHGRINVQFNNGEHGFDNNNIDMKTIFRAVGPSFKTGLEVEPFESVHVYELLCQLLGIMPEANDGDLSTLLPMLRPATSQDTQASLPIRTHSDPMAGPDPSGTGPAPVLAVLSLPIRLEESTSTTSEQQGLTGAGITTENHNHITHTHSGPRRGRRSRRDKLSRRRVAPGSAHAQRGGAIPRPSVASAAGPALSPGGAVDPGPRPRDGTVSMAARGAPPSPSPEHPLPRTRNRSEGVCVVAARARPRRGWASGSPTSGTSGTSLPLTRLAAPGVAALSHAGGGGSSGGASGRWKDPGPSRTAGAEKAIPEGGKPFHRLDNPIRSTFWVLLLPQTWCSVTVISLVPTCPAPPRHLPTILFCGLSRLSAKNSHLLPVHGVHRFMSAPQPRTHLTNSSPDESY
ncbi:ectonucleotide pyrophosphatase/phosphodiesterase family member 7 [Carlito syrichta]|uniref:Ectonucleotide pyrophosphatase/phosphodiesterase family member 7 n=1 Tax=Carlito syrichta TaxID=1868482 RepID=A0A3Q0DKG5_CARSF|nr:ectonucleotide pyrophosphatase/phosphodiesterase family member 7 [Carlito syrichta]